MTSGPTEIPTENGTKMNYPQPGYQPQQQYPAQPAPQQPQYPGYPQQVQQPAYAPPAQQFGQPGGYPPQGAPQQPPAVPLAKGSVSDFYSQPSPGGGPSISWTDKQGMPKQLGTQYVGIVARDVTDADVQQQTDFNTKQPLFFRDGRPKFAMKVPLKVQPSEEFPEGEATWYVKGQARDELVRAMAEAGVSGEPKAGAAIAITLVQRRPSGRGLNPSNVVQVQYQPPTGAGATSPAPAPQAVQQPAPQAPQQQFQQPEPSTYQQPAPQAAPVQQYAQQPLPGQQAPAQPQFQQPAQQQAPQAQSGMQVPPDFNAEQAQLLARIAGGQQQAG